MTTKVTATQFVHRAGARNVKVVIEAEINDDLTVLSKRHIADVAIHGPGSAVLYLSPEDAYEIQVGIREALTRADWGGVVQ